MDFEKYTERVRGFIQSAHSLALREGNPQFTPEHLLKVLLDDPEGLCAGLIDRSGGKADIGVPLVSLAQLDIPSYAPDQLPPELAAIPATKPGSRGIKA